MPVPEGLRVTLNEIKRTLVENNVVYAQQLPTIMPDTSIGSLADVLFDKEHESFFTNQFMPELIQRIMFTSIEHRIYANPLESLKNGEMPLGGIAQDIMVNRVKSMAFDVNDFAGLLAKYETDIKVIYNKLNWDHQYAATISYDNIRDAFTTWDKLYNLTDEIAQQMYNEAAYDDFRLTKYLISNAYRNNQIIMKQIAPVTDEASAKNLVKVARALYAGFKFMSTEYNGWNLNGGYGLPVRTMTPAQDIVMFIKASDMATIDVDVLAAAFHMSSTEFLGRVHEVDNFDIIDEETGEKIFDGSNIVAVIGDRKWFDIRQQMRRFNQFFNAKNETWQLFLHVKEGFNTRPFANMVALVTETPTVPVTGLNYKTEEITINAGETEGLDINVIPVTATTPITYKVTKNGASSSTRDITLDPSADTRNVKLNVKAGVSGNYVLTASADAVSTSIRVTVPVAAVQSSLEVSDDKSQTINKSGE